MFYGINFSQCILHDSAVFFSHFQSFFKLWMWQLVSFGQPIPQNEWIIGTTFIFQLYKFEGIKFYVTDQISMYSTCFSSACLRTAGSFIPLSYISILKIWKALILRHRPIYTLHDSAAFWSVFSIFSQIMEEGTDMIRGTNST